MKIKSITPLVVLIFLTLIPFRGGSVTAFVPKEPTVAMKFEAGKKYFATIKTDKGDIVCELNTEKAPLSTTNFVQLSEGGFYKGLTFHRVVPDFVIQGGDPAGTGSGGPGYTVKGETNNGLKHVEGALAWARLGDAMNPDRKSSGSQFYITLAATPFLDNQYTVFGLTIKGMDVVKKIQVGDKIVDVIITKE